MDWHYSDGGRAAAGYKGTTDDCVTRAVAIAADLPYQRVYEAINKSLRPSGKAAASGGAPAPVLASTSPQRGATWSS